MVYYVNNDNSLETVAAAMLGMALIAWAYITAIVIWLLVSGILAYQRYLKLLREAEETFERVHARLGRDIAVDPVLESVFGVRFTQDEADDWLGSSIFGVTA